MQKVIEVILNQAPDVLAQQLIIERMDCLGWFVVSGAGLIACIFGIKWMWKQGDDLYGMGAVVLTLVAAICAIGVVSNPVGFAETFLAPKAVAVNAMLYHLRK